MKPTLFEETLAYIALFPTIFLPKLMFAIPLSLLITLPITIPMIAGKRIYNIAKFIAVGT